MNKQDFANLPEGDRMNRILEGTSYFACVHRPNLSAAKKFNALPFFGVNLGLDDAGVKQAKEFGLKVHPADDFIPMPYVKIQRKIKPGKTAEETKPDVVDSNQRALPASVLIGNGSTVRCKFGTYWYDNGGGGVGTTLFKVQVRELEAYDSKIDRDLVMDDAGYQVPDDIGTESTESSDEDGFKSPTEFDK